MTDKLPFMKYFKLFALLFALSTTVLNAAGKYEKTICLNMIVKDEKPVILKCLESVKPFIDYWVIVDTGSKDGTQQAIRDYMADIPGELHERPWVHFAHNRNEARELALKKADYCLFIDADEILAPSASFKMPKLDSNLYSISISVKKEDSSTITCPRVFLVKNQFPCKWEGPLHEQIQSDFDTIYVHIPDIAIKTDTVSGHRAQDPQKHLKDAQMLKKLLEKEPNDPRIQFLLGGTYDLAKEDQLALEALEKCAQMKNCPEGELYRSLFQIGLLQERLGKPSTIFLASYEKAFRHRPSRAEPLFFMASYFMNINNWQKAYDLLKKAIAIPLPENDSYVERSIYTWGALYNLIACSERLGKTEETILLLKQLVSSPELPPEFHDKAEKNLADLNKRFANKNLH